MVDVEAIASVDPGEGADRHSVRSTGWPLVPPDYPKYTRCGKGPSANAYEDRIQNWFCKILSFE